MSTDGATEIDWGGDRRRFRLGIDELLALQKLCNAGPLSIAQRLRDGTWRVDDVREALRLGLMGGGLDGKEARDLVERFCGPGRLVYGALVAFNVLMPALQGDPDDPVGKEPATAEAPGATTTASPPPPSSEVER